HGARAIFTALSSQGRDPRLDGAGLQSRDFTYVGNVVQALSKAADAPAAPGNVYNIGTGGCITVLDLVCHLNTILGKNIEPTFGPPRPGDRPHSQADISPDRRDLGYAPTVKFPEGLQKTLEWYQSLKKQ